MSRADVPRVAGLQVYGDTDMFRPAVQQHVYHPGVEYDNASGFVIIMRDHSQALDSAASTVFPGALHGYCTVHRVVRHFLCAFM